jgi:hypothetical protein
MIAFGLLMTPDRRLWPRRRAFRAAALMPGKERRPDSTDRIDRHTPLSKVRREQKS